MHTYLFIISKKKQAVLYDSIFRVWIKDETNNMLL